MEKFSFFKRKGKDGGLSEVVEVVDAEARERIATLETSGGGTGGGTGTGEDPGEAATYAEQAKESAEQAAASAEAAATSEANAADSAEAAEAAAGAAYGEADRALACANEANAAAQVTGTDKTEAAASAEAAEAAETAAKAAQTAAEAAKAEAQSAADSASESKTAAADSAATAASKATEAGNSATAAAEAKTAAESAQSDAETAANTATARASAASDYADDALIARDEAQTFKSNAADSATNAAASADTATEQAGYATNSAHEALQGANQAATSAVNAAASETNAATSATNAANSASTASSKATAASNSASAAKTSETNASASATAASDSADAAAASAEAAQAAADSINGGAKAYTVPDFWRDSVDATIAAIKEQQDAAGAECVCFGLVSDMHVHWPYPTDNNYCQNVGNIGAAVMDGADVPLFLNCGDILTNTVYEEESNVIKAYDWAWDNYLSTIGADRMLLVAGNHDGAYAVVNEKNYAKNMNPAKLHRYLYQEQMKDFRRVWGDSGKYFYMDNVPQKTRFIMLNSHDTEWAEDENGAAVCSTMSGGYRQEQMEWLIDALDVPTGWTIVLASHVPPTAKLPTSYSGTRGYSIVRGIVSAYANREAYSGSYTYDSTKGEGLWANMNVSVDFTDAKGTIAGWFCGHCHRDAVVSGDLPFPVVTITCAGNFSYDKDNEGTRTLGTANETAVDFVCINKATKRLNIFRMGAGVDASRSAVYAGDFTIKATLANVSSSNAATLIGEGEAYTATLTAADGYSMGAVTVIMGGVDVTSSYYADGVISIPSVTGNIVITAEGVSNDPFAFVASNWTAGGSSSCLNVESDGITVTKAASGNSNYAFCNHVFTRKAGTYTMSFKTNGVSTTNTGVCIVRCFDASGNAITEKGCWVPNHSYVFNTAYQAHMMNSGYADFTFTLTEDVATFQVGFVPGSTIEATTGTAKFTDIVLTEPE